MKGEKEGDDKEEPEKLSRRFAGISPRWQLLTLPTLPLSFCALLLDFRFGRQDLENFFISLFLVSLVLQLIISALAVCPYCGKPLTYRPPRYNESQGKLFFFPLKNCWSCKTNLERGQKHD